MVWFLAQVIDWLVNLAALVFSPLVILPVLKQLLRSTALSALLTLLTTVLLAIMIQIPSWNVNQTAGKAFFGLEIQSSNVDRPFALSTLAQREISCKLMGYYLVYLPML